MFSISVSYNEQQLFQASNVPRLLMTNINHFEYQYCQASIMVSLNYENINYIMSQFPKLSCVSFSYVSINYVLGNWRYKDFRASGHSIVWAQKVFSLALKNPIQSSMETENPRYIKQYSLKEPSLLDSVVFVKETQDTLRSFLKQCIIRINKRKYQQFYDNL